jgi:hypothetical protein
LFCLAALTFKDKNMLDVAVKMGEITWKYGLLLKGNGLCHGISGNGYFLHTLFRTLKECGEDKQAEIWQIRAHLFAQALSD